MSMALPKHLPSWIRIALICIWFGVAGAAVLLFQDLAVHLKEMFAYSFIIPVLVASFYYGRLGGLSVALLSSLVCGSMAIGNPDDLESPLVQRILFQIILFNIVALFTSWLSEREKKAKDLYHSLFEDVPVGIYHSSPAGRVLAANATLMHMLGYTTPADLLGINLDQTYMDSGLRKKWTTTLENKGTLEDIEIQLKRRDGSLIWVKNKAHIVRDEEGKVVCYEGILEDITTRKETEDALWRSEKKYRDIFENAIEGLFQTLPDGHIITANTAMASLLGFDSPQDLMAHEPLLIRQSFVDNNDLDKLLSSLLKNGFVQDFGSRIYTRGKNIIDVSINIQTVRDRHQKPLYYEGFISDITERKRLDKLRIANRVQSEFISTMSHEIRTPLNSILGFSELLETQITDKQHQEYLSAISSSGRILLSLINDILDLSKIEANKIDLHYTATNVRTIFAETRNIFSQKVKEKGLDLEIEIDPGLPETLLLDEIRLRQILFNLVGNAIKFTSCGHIDLSVHASISRTNHNLLDLKFAVKDTGIGIAPEQQETIFENFRQVDGQDYSKYGGSGLGLAISKRLVGVMGGELSLNSAVGQGSTFEVLIRDVAQTRAENPMDEAIDMDLDAMRFEPAEIIIADDYENARALLKGLLMPYGFHLIEAVDGKQVLELAREHCPDLILMDIKMPVMSGHEALKVLREDKDTENIPVVAVTVSSMPNAGDLSNRFEFNGYLRKPVSRNGLILEIARFLAYSFDKTPSGKTKTVSTPDTLTSPPPETISRLPNLLKRIESDYMGPWSKLQKTMNFKKIQGFALDIKELGTEYHLDALVQWAEDLDKLAMGFDIERLPNTIQQFPELVQWISKHMVHVDLQEKKQPKID
ncbi:MAG: PAS domain S-box protein [Thermodesulfobacteriota bacterium]|nr:PAS domain S-box protein [Thermodesulfobacteriota bacterium]